MGQRKSLLCAEALHYGAWEPLEAGAGQWAMGPDGTLTWEDQGPCCAYPPPPDHASDTLRVDVGRLTQEETHEHNPPWKDQRNPMIYQEDQASVASEGDDQSSPWKGQNNFWPDQQEQENPPMSPHSPCSQASASEQIGGVWPVSYPQQRVSDQDTGAGVLRFLDEGTDRDTPRLASFSLA